MKRLFALKTKNMEDGDFKTLAKNCKNNEDKYKKELQTLTKLGKTINKFKSVKLKNFDTAFDKITGECTTLLADKKTDKSTLDDSAYKNLNYEKTIEEGIKNINTKGRSICSKLQILCRDMKQNLKDSRLS